MAIRAASIWLEVIHAGSVACKTKLTVGHGVAAGGLALQAAAVNAAVFDSLGQQH